jgi:hypothetical protein
MDGRQEHNDARDRARILDAVRDGTLAPGVTYAHVRASSEPVLWLADALSGAALAALRGRPQYLRAVPHPLNAVSMAS